MFIKDVLKMSLLNAFRGRIRSVLTALSIAIGVSSVLLVTSIGASGEKVIVREVEKLGLGGIGIYQNSEAKSKALYSEDAESIKKRFKEVSVALPVVLEYGGLRFNKTDTDAVLFGIGEKADQVYDVTVLHGRIPNNSDVKNVKKVAVIDEELALKSYKRTNVIGKEIVINLRDNTEKYQIIGVIKSQKDGINKMLGGSVPDFVYVPYTTLNKMRNSDTLSQISVKCIGSQEENGEKFADYLSRKNGLENAYISENMSSKIGEIQTITGLVSLIISAIAAISLCVAGIGIMNTMFSSTTERYREIGICMAVGACSRDIMLCFFVESIIISLIGGTIGGIIGWLATLGISGALNVESVYSMKTFLFAEMISVFCGGIFSVIPAYKASRLDPIITLRSN